MTAFAIFWAGAIIYWVLAGIRDELRKMNSKR